MPAGTMARRLAVSAATGAGIVRLIGVPVELRLGRVACAPDGQARDTVGAVHAGRWAQTAAAAGNTSARAHEPAARAGIKSLPRIRSLPGVGARACIWSVPGIGDLAGIGWVARIWHRRLEAAVVGTHVQAARTAEGDYPRPLDPAAQAHTPPSAQMPLQQPPPGISPHVSPGGTQAQTWPAGQAAEPLPWGYPVQHRTPMAGQVWPTSRQHVSVPPPYSPMQL
jgi:hypothetical protein